MQTNLWGRSKTVEKDTRLGNRKAVDTRGYESSARDRSNRTISGPPRGKIWSLGRNDTVTRYTRGQHEAGAVTEYERKPDTRQAKGPQGPEIAANFDAKVDPPNLKDFGNESLMTKCFEDDQQALTKNFSVAYIAIFIYSPCWEIVS